MRRRFIAAGIALLVATGILVMLLLSDSGSGDSLQRAGSDNPPLAMSRLDEKSAAVLERGLNGTSAADQAKALCPALRQSEYSVANVLPDGATLSIDPASFKGKGSEGSVKATTGGSIKAEFVLYLAQDSDKSWCVFATQRVR